MEQRSKAYRKKESKSYYPPERHRRKNDSETGRKKPWSHLWHKPGGSHSWVRTGGEPNTQSKRKENCGYYKKY